LVCIGIAVAIYGYQVRTAWIPETRWMIVPPVIAAVAAIFGSRWREHGDKVAYVAIAGSCAMTAASYALVLFHSTFGVRDVAELASIMRAPDRTLVALALLAMIAVGVCVGFLPHNFNPARIMMGDGGAWDQVTWVEAVVERVWLEGFKSNLGILWDGFVYAVGTGTDQTFRYASITHGGPGALQHDGDNEINGIMGTRADFQPPVVPEPETYALMLAGLAAVGFAARRRKALK
jgi:hypothetical protein